MVCIRCKRLLLNRARSNADIARPRKSLRRNLCLRKIQTQARQKSARRSAGVLCRCTGYLKPVQAVLKAAAEMRGDEPLDLESINWDFGTPQTGDTPQSDDSAANLTGVMTGRPKVVVTPETKTWQTVGKPEIKVDAIKLVQGKPAFTADFEKRGMLHAKVLHSPHAHARIKKIDTSKAKAT